MSFYSYEVLKTIVEQGSFVRASEYLNLTPSAVSHIIAKLENELGMQLLIRGKKGVTLTNCGEQLMPFISTLIDSNDMLEGEIDRIREVDSGLVRIGAFESITELWLPEIIRSYNKEYPNVDVELYQGDYNDVISWIENKQVDIALISAAALEKAGVADKYSTLPLHKDRLMFVCPHGHFTDGRKTASMEEIRDMDFVMQIESCDHEVQRLLNKYQVNVDVKFKLESDDAMIALVEAGLGACIHPEMIVRGTTRNVDIYPIRPAEYRVISILIPNSGYISPSVQCMRELLLSYVQQKGLMNF